MSNENVEKNEVKIVEEQVEEAKSEVLSTPSSDNTIVNKELISSALDNLKGEINHLKVIEDNQNANVKKVLSIYDKTINAISILLEKDAITDEERKYYVSVASKYHDSIKEILLSDEKNKQEDKKFHHNLINVEVSTVSVGFIIGIIGKTTVSIIKALKK